MCILGLRLFFIFCVFKQKGFNDTFLFRHFRVLFSRLENVEINMSLKLFCLKNAKYILWLKIFNRFFLTLDFSDWQCLLTLKSRATHCPLKTSPFFLVVSILLGDFETTPKNSLIMSYKVWSISFILGSLSVQHKLATRIQPQKSISSTQKDHSFSAPQNPSVQHKRASVEHKCVSSTTELMCWTERVCAELRGTFYPVWNDV